MKLGRFELDNIYNEDCYKAIKDIPDKSIDLIVTDPPYEYTTGGGAGCFGTKTRKYHEEYYSIAKNTTLNDRKVKSRKEILNISSGIDYSLLDEFDRIMKKINIYIWCSKHQVEPLLRHYIEKDCNIEILTWHKTNPLPTMNNTYANDTEYCIFAREKGVELYGNYETKRKYYITSLNVNDKDKFEHPTIKPMHIIKNLIINSSNENDIVLDCFAGSGTTLVTSKDLGRHYIGFEIDKKWYEIAKNRLNKVDAKGQMNMFLV